MTVLFAVFLATVQAGLDRVKWAHGEDCFADGILGSVGDVDGMGEFELGYFEDTGFTAQTIQFPESEIGGPYAMCCEFASNSLHKRDACRPQNCKEFTRKTGHKNRAAGTRLCATGTGCAS